MYLFCLQVDCAIFIWQYTDIDYWELLLSLNILMILGRWWLFLISLNIYKIALLFIYFGVGFLAKEPLTYINSIA